MTDTLEMNAALIGSPAIGEPDAPMPADISNMIWRLLIGDSALDEPSPQKRKGRAKAASNLTHAIHRAGQLEGIVLEFLQTYRQAARRAQMIKQADLVDPTEVHRLCDAMSADSRRCLFLMEAMSSLVGERRGGKLRPGSLRR